MSFDAQKKRPIMECTSLKISPCPAAVAWAYQENPVRGRAACADPEGMGCPDPPLFFVCLFDLILYVQSTVNSLLVKQGRTGLPELNQY